jgi:hypothetical protein
MHLTTWELEMAAAHRRREAMADVERANLLAEAEAGRPRRMRRVADWLTGVARCVRSQSARMDSPRALRQQSGCAS